MQNEPVNTFKFTWQNKNGEVEIKGEIIGNSSVSNYDDIKLKAIIALLNSTDKRNFIDSHQTSLFDTLITEIEETTDLVKKYESFLGKHTSI